MSARRLHRALAGGALLAAALAAGCLQQADPADAEQLEVDCRNAECPWEVKSGKATVGTTWLEGDRGVDLSGTGRVVVELPVVMLQQTSRTLDFRAGVVRDAAAKLRFEIEWYAAGPGIAGTFWDRQPIALGNPTSFEIWEEGANHVRRTILVPSEGAAFILRVVKESDAAASVMVGDLTIGHPSGSTL